MYNSWISWLEQVGSEIELNQEFKRLLARKQELKTELCYLQKEESVAYNNYSKLKLAYARARYEYHQVDFKLATIDGRLTICEEIKEEQIREKNLGTIVDQLTPSERSALLAELEGMED